MGENIMICVFCGKENDKFAEKCSHCGYVFDPSMHEIKKSEYDDFSDNKDSIELMDYDTDSGHIGKEIYAKWEEEKSKYQNEIRNNSATTLKKTNSIEIITSIVLFAIALLIILFGITTGSWEIIFEINYMIILGIIGAIAFVMCGLFEGQFPGSLPGLILRTVALIIVMESPNAVTIILFVAAIGISVFFLKDTYNRLPPILLGIVSMIFLPFLGIFAAIIIGLLFRELSGSKRNKAEK